MLMDDVDILYVIGNGSVNNNAELKYSLRTVSRHCKGVGRVVISGEIPSFVGGRAETVSCTDISISGKHWNMLHKIAEGIRRGGLVKPFLFSSDDHFFTRDFRMPLWTRRLRRERIYTEAEYEAENGKPAGRYQRAVAATGELLRSRNLPDEDVVWHGNMWIDPKYLNDVLAIANSHGQCIYGYEPLLLFHAFWRRDHRTDKIQPLPRDVKVKSFEGCMNLASAYGVFSTDDRAWRGGELLKWFRKNYPEKSEFEK